MEFLFLIALAVVGGFVGKFVTAKFLLILTVLAGLFVFSIPTEGIGFLIFAGYGIVAAAVLVPAWVVNLMTNENLDTSSLDRIGKFFLR
jgi:Flp pilus assembly protein TadB